jgi:Mg-chelatase subunit ChlI
VTPPDGPLPRYEMHLATPANAKPFVRRMEDPEGSWVKWADVESRLRAQEAEHRKLLEDWREQDRALQRLWELCGIDQAAPPTPADIATHLEAALAACRAERAQIAQVVTAAQQVVDTFKRDEAAGYRSRDRQFAIEVLSQALLPAPPAAPPPEHVAKTHNPATGRCTRCDYTEAEGHKPTCIHYDYWRTHQAAPPAAPPEPT